MKFENLSNLTNSNNIETMKLTVITAGTELPLASIKYSTGTITLTLGSKNVTGSGTSFVGNVASGDRIETAGGRVYIIEAVSGNTSLVLYSAASVSETGVTYKIFTLNPTIKVYIKAKSTNTSLIYIGTKGVTSTTGFQLAAGKTISFKVNNKDSNIYIDSNGNNQIAYVVMEKGGLMQVYVPTSIATNQRLRTGGTPGTFQLITSKIDTVSVNISALSTNVASIYVGVSGVADTTGYELVPGDNVTLNVNDKIADIFIYAADGEGCSYLVTKP